MMIDSRSHTRSAGTRRVVARGLAAVIIVLSLYPTAAIAETTRSTEDVLRRLSPLRPVLRLLAPLSPPAGSRTTLDRARSELARQILAHPQLSGATVEMGDARGYEGIAYYQTGRIVIDPNSSTAVETIVRHEIWHILDWRDNQTIDWGENVPPLRPGPAR